jgi:lipoprotein signal peptidase
VIDYSAVARVGRHDWGPVITVADTCIVVGAFLLALSVSRRGRETPRADGPPGLPHADG